MKDIEALLAERERCWDEHPIITESAILPTRSVKDAVARVMLMSRKSRASIAFWADPVTGKSFCIQAIRRAIEGQYPDAGTVVLEAVEDKQQAEGRLLLGILKSIGFAHKVDRDLAGKRDQVRRALVSLSGPARRLFIIIDEAQEVANDEFAWLKAVINGLSGAGIKVTTVMFGQRELIERRQDLQTNGRSDLCERFMKNLLEFRGVRVMKDLEVICEALDDNSEYPRGSKWTYTMLLFPRAYGGGFRFSKIVPDIWNAIRSLIPPRMLSKGLPMEIVAAFIANLCLEFKKGDAEDLVMSDVAITKALKLALGKS